MQKQHNKLHHDQTYFGLRDIEHLFSDIISFKPILVRSSFKSKFEEYEISGDVKKVLTVKEYLYVIYDDLEKLHNKKKLET